MSAHVGKTGLALVLLMLAWLPGCRTTDFDYAHTRYDYWAFRARSGRLPEPNYIPWAMHHEKLPSGGTALVACRWPDDAFPLRWYAEPPIIPEKLQDEFRPRVPVEYTRAVARAFEQWQDEIGRPVRFKRVDAPEQAQLVVKLVAAEVEMDEGHVLGMVRDEAGRCRVTGPGPDPDHFTIEYAAPEMYLYVADRVGLLTPHQVHAIALHELGHVLGVSGQHSPLRGDVMYKVANDRRVDMLSQHDVNTLRALYRVPPGSVYTRTDIARERPMPEVRRDPPRLDRPIVDERYDIEVRFPRGWQVIRSPRGWIAVDGVSWDYDASIQVIASRGRFDAARATDSLVRFATGEIERTELLEIDGQPVARVVYSKEDRTEEMSMIGWDEGWVLFVIADARADDFQLYQSWFRSVMLSLDHPVRRDGQKGRGPGVAAPSR